MKVAIVNYGMGNLNSVATALENLRADVRIAETARDLADAERIVLPGVGAFGRGIENLRKIDGMVDALAEQVLARQRPILGICLGMQLFARESREHGRHAGLGWIDARVLPFGRGQAAVKSIHIGWADVRPRTGSSLFAGLGDSPSFYFDHGFYVTCDDTAALSASSYYGQPFAAALQKGNIFGVQFHPEKSQEAGMVLLRNFLRVDPQAAPELGPAVELTDAAPKVRVMATLTLKNGRMVKTVRFGPGRDVGDPIKAPTIYDAQLTDELVYVDMHASLEGRSIDQLLNVIPTLAGACFMPLTVGGGIRSVDDIRRLLRAGAEKVAINTAAVERPAIIQEASEAFGSQCVVIAIDVRASNGGYQVFTHSGTRASGLDAVSWARCAAELGAGEILLTSIDRDGTLAGYDLDLIRRVADAVDIPVIASGGAAHCQDLVDAAREGHAAAVAAASLYHFRDESPIKAKAALRRAGLPTR